MCLNVQGVVNSACFSTIEQFIKVTLLAVPKDSQDNVRQTYTMSVITYDGVICETSNRPLSVNYFRALS